MCERGAAQERVTGVMTSQINANPTRALSQHGRVTQHRWSVQALNLNAWCRIPGSPFSSGLALQPNPVDDDRVSVTYGPFELPPGVDSFTFILNSETQLEHRNAIGVDVSLLDSSHRALAEGRRSLRRGEEAALSFSFDRTTQRRVFFRFAAEFDEFHGGAVFGSVRLVYMLAYRGNPLVDLFNATGSDKGTEARAGHGVPHCYALNYFELLAPLRHDSFNFLEIGLAHVADALSERTDAPSLRAWAAFFPKAHLYGFDIEDFSFLELARTTTFRGDQGSRADLVRFLEAHGCPTFRVILDDGSHAASHQQVSLGALFRCLEPGGLYLIEDLGWQPFEEAPTTTQVLCGWIENRRIETPFMPDEDARYLEEHLADVQFLRPNDSAFALICKRDA